MVGGPADARAGAGAASAGAPGADRSGAAAARGSREAVVLLCPVVPALGGNGLAMRAGMLLEALAEDFDVDLVVTAVSGPLTGEGWARGLARTFVALAAVTDPGAARRHLTRQLADPFLRERLARCAPLPSLARLAPPTLAAAALERLAPGLERPPRAVFVLRGYLAPLGLTLARSLGARRAIVDLDDDDEAFARAAGLAEEADAHARLARAWLPDADVVCAAAPAEAAAIAARHSLEPLVVLPNAIRPPARTSVPPGAQRLLFVGNLTYAPNVEAAVVLAHEILPLVRESHPAASVDLVGPHDGTVAASEHVRVAGRVEALEPWYEGADLVVAALRSGGGTRIKLLEAFAHRRAVVASETAAAGLAVRDGREIAIGRSPRELAALVCALLEDRQRAAAMASAASAVVSARYLQAVVAPQVRALAGAPAGPS